jgi:hypothetical protein
MVVSGGPTERLSNQAPVREGLSVQDDATLGEKVNKPIGKARMWGNCWGWNCGWNMGRWGWNNWNWNRWHSGNQWGGWNGWNWGK